MTVYVVVRDYGYEGLSKPLAVFTDRRLAEAMKAGNDGYNKVLIFEYELDRIPE